MNLRLYLLHARNSHSTIAEREFLGRYRDYLGAARYHSARIERYRERYSQLNRESKKLDSERLRRIHELERKLFYSELGRRMLEEWGKSPSWGAVVRDARELLREDMQGLNEVLWQVMRPKQPEPVL